MSAVGRDQIQVHYPLHVPMDGKPFSKPPVESTFCRPNRILGTTFTCNPSSFPTGCPAGYDCAQSTQPGTYVCCSPSLGKFSIFFFNPLSGTSTTIAPSFQQCPNGWNPYKNSVNQAVQYCSSTTDQRYLFL